MIRLMRPHSRPFHRRIGHDQDTSDLHKQAVLRRRWATRWTAVVAVWMHLQMKKMMMAEEVSDQLQDIQDT